MKITAFVLTLLLSGGLAFTQVTDAEKQLKTQSADSVLGWKKGGVINFNTSQTSLTNWAAGGQSSVAVGGLVSLFAHNKQEKGLWENYLDLAYGTLKQGKQAWWKTDDKIDFTSKYGYNLSKTWYLAGLVNFKTQMADGYNYPNDSVKISAFMAPGYLLGALGFDYIPNDHFTVFIAPLTTKMTFVIDEVLSDAGAFGVDPGKSVFSEFGGYARITAKADLMENIGIQTKLDLFTNYLRNPQNIDVSWEVLLNMKINEFFAATVTTHLLYDDDIDIEIDKNDDGVTDAKGPRIQFKEVLAIGFSLKF